MQCTICTLRSIQRRIMYSKLELKLQNAIFASWWQSILEYYNNWKPIREHSRWASIFVGMSITLRVNLLEDNSEKKRTQNGSYG